MIGSTARETPRLYSENYESAPHGIHLKLSLARNIQKLSHWMENIASHPRPLTSDCLAVQPSELVGVWDWHCVAVAPVLYVCGVGSATDLMKVLLYVTATRPEWTFYISLFSFDKLRNSPVDRSGFET